MLSAVLDLGTEVVNWIIMIVNALTRLTTGSSLSS